MRLLTSLGLAKHFAKQRPLSPAPPKAHRGAFVFAIHAALNSIEPFLMNVALIDPFYANTSDKRLAAYLERRTARSAFKRVAKKS